MNFRFNQYFDFNMLIGPNKPFVSMHDNLE